MKAYLLATLVFLISFSLSVKASSVLNCLKRERTNSLKELPKALYKEPSLALAHKSFYDLDILFKNIKNFDDFINDQDLIDQYYGVLLKYYGGGDASRFNRKSYNAIIEQMKALTQKYPYMKKRLWESPNGFQSFSITSEIKSYGRKLNVPKWNLYLSQMKKGFKDKASSVSNLSKANKVKFIEKRFTELRAQSDSFDKEMSSATSKKQKKAISQKYQKEIFSTFKSDPEYIAIENYYLDEMFKADSQLMDYLNSGEANLVIEAMTGLKDTKIKIFFEQFNLNELPKPPEFFINGLRKYFPAIKPKGSIMKVSDELVGYTFADNFGGSSVKKAVSDDLIGMYVDDNSLLDMMSFNRKLTKKAIEHLKEKGIKEISVGKFPQNINFASGDTVTKETIEILQKYGIEEIAVVHPGYFDNMKNNPNLATHEVPLLQNVDIFPPQTTTTRNGNRIADAGAKVSDYNFIPIGRRIHSIWKGLNINECVGGNCLSLESLTPQRWASSLNDNAVVYAVESNESYLGFIQYFPLKYQDDLYMSVDFGANILSSPSGAINPATGMTESGPLYEFWLRQAQKNLPNQYKGFVVGGKPCN